jgi:hypothetical protein
VRRIARTIERDDLLALVGKVGYAQAARTLGVSVATAHRWVGEVGGHAEVVIAAKARRKSQVPIVGPTAIAAARRALHGASGTYRQALQARVDYPTDSLNDIADRFGWNRNSYATRLRRALAPVLGRR